MTGFRRFVSHDDDSGRWTDFAFRDGDIVISTRSKHGTTWMQMICALLVHGGPDLPAPLNRLSPWLDHRVESIDDVIARLDAQDHRRIVKTHTPLPGIPIDPRATYVVVGRHPLDGALSMYHHGRNIDRQRLAELTGRPAGTGPVAASEAEWLRAFVEADPDPEEAFESLPGVLWHLGDAWDRRHEPNVVLVHYHDLETDLAGEMRRLAGELSIGIDESALPGLVEAAGFEAMRERAAQTAPDALGVLRDRDAFFRSGRSGGGPLLLTDEELTRYHERCAELAPAELLGWLNRPAQG